MLFRSSSEWSTAWRSASRAIAFIFEHRGQELAEYGDYIKRLFAAKRAGSHGQVTRESEMKLEGGKRYCSPTTTTSPPCMLPPCKTMESSIRSPVVEEEVAAQKNQRRKCALDSTVRGVAGSLSQHVSTDTRAWAVVKPGTENQRSEEQRLNSSHSS